MKMQTINLTHVLLLDVATLLLKSIEMVGKWGETFTYLLLLCERAVIFSVHLMLWDESRVIFIYDLGSDTWVWALCLAVTGSSQPSTSSLLILEELGHIISVKVECIRVIPYDQSFIIEFLFIMAGFLFLSLSYYRWTESSVTKGKLSKSWTLGDSWERSRIETPCM